MYSLYLDESGTHGGSPVFVLAGIAVHEQDAFHLQQRLTNVLGRLPDDPRDWELHAAEIKSPTRVEGSSWQAVDYRTRMRILRAAYRAISTYTCMNSDFPCTMFGAVIERTYADYEERAWEEVLHRFDEMMERQARASGEHQRGVVIADRSVLERRVQRWADRWRIISGRIGVLTHLADVPFFADSKASRLLQAADLVAFSLWRYYGPRNADPSLVESLWNHFDSHGGRMHGCIHVRRRFRATECPCPPCQSRLAP